MTVVERELMLDGRSSPTCRGDETQCTWVGGGPASSGAPAGHCARTGWQSARATPAGKLAELQGSPLGQWATRAERMGGACHPASTLKKHCESPRIACCPGSPTHYSNHNLKNGRIINIASKLSMLINFKQTFTFKYNLRTFL